MSSKLTCKKQCDLPKSFQKSNYNDKDACLSCNNNNQTLQGLDLANLLKEIEPTTNSLLLTLLLQNVCQKTVINRKVDVNTQTDIYFSSYSPATSTRHRDKSTHKRRRSSKRRHRHRSKDHRHRKRRRSSRSHKKEKRVSRKERACSPSYSDYEPENPILRLRAK